MARNFNYGKQQVVASDLPTNSVSAGQPHLYSTEKYPLVSVSSDVAKSRALSINAVQIPNNGLVYVSAPPSLNFAFGNLSIASSNTEIVREFCAGIQLQWGNEGVDQTAVFDFRPGTYSIPPSQIVKVFLVVYRPYTVAVTQTYFFEAALADVAVPFVGKRPTVTWNANVANAGGVNWPFQQQTRWLDFAYSGPLALGDANAPVLSLLYPLSTGQSEPVVQKDYVNKTWFPSGGPYEVNAFDTSARLGNDGAAYARVTAREFLEF
jgi:hypothetical protein